MARRAAQNTRKGRTQLAAHNTGVSGTSGYGRSRYNATTHGIFSQSKVLKWEDEEEYNAHEKDFFDEYQPAGVTERELVEDLVWVSWRKKRLRLAEHAAINDGLREAVEQRTRTANAAVTHSAQHLEFEDVEFERAFGLPPEILDLEFEEFHQFFMGTFEAIQTLEFAARKGFGNHEETVDEALETLPAIFRDEIKVAREDETIVPENEDSLAAALANFIRTTFYPRLSYNFNLLNLGESLPLQAIGSAFFSDELQKIVRYEAHLDRKFETTLATLFRLQEIRQRREAKKTR